MDLKTVKLLDILSACRPEDDRLARISALEAIRHMEAYQGYRPVMLSRNDSTCS